MTGTGGKPGPSRGGGLRRQVGIANLACANSPLRRDAGAYRSQARPRGTATNLVASSDFTPHQHGALAVPMGVGNGSAHVLRLGDLRKRTALAVAACRRVD